MEGKDLGSSNSSPASRDILVTAFFAYGQHVLNNQGNCRNFSEAFLRCIGKYRIVDGHADGSFSVVCDDGSVVAFTSADPYCKDLYELLKLNNI